VVCLTQLDFFIALRQIAEAVEAEKVSRDSDDKPLPPAVGNDKYIIKPGSSERRTPLHHAARLGRDDLVKILLDGSPITDVDVLDAEKCTPLHLAARNGHKAVVLTLIRNGANVRVQESYDETPLHEASRNGHDKIVRILIDHGAVVDAPNTDHCTALHIAARRGHHVVVRKLLHAGANPQTRDALQDTPLHDASRNGHEEAVRVLLDTDNILVDPQNENDITPLSVAARYGQEAVVRQLIEAGADVDSVSSEYCTPLHQAACEGHDGVTRILIAGGADVNMQDKDEQTALHTAVISGYEQVVQSLLAADAAVNLRDNDDCTPLHHAVKIENANIVQYLLEAGADPTVISKDGETPQSLAKQLSENTIADLFNSPQIIPKQRPEPNFRPVRAKGPLKPNKEIEIEVCQHFKGLFWCPTSNSSFDNMSVWDILYNPETEAKMFPKPRKVSPSPRMRSRSDVMPDGRRKERKSSHSMSSERPMKRWFHLPANNVSSFINYSLFALQHTDLRLCVIDILGYGEFVDT
jgi:ankyrin repeat protein